MLYVLNYKIFNFYIKKFKNKEQNLKQMKQSLENSAQKKLFQRLYKNHRKTSMLVFFFFQQSCRL